MSEVSPRTYRNLKLTPFPSAGSCVPIPPQYASQITAAAKSAFLSGDHAAYAAGIVAILLGAALVFFLFPKKDSEERLLAEYHSQDTRHTGTAK